MRHNKVEFSPLHGLASLGAGGLSVSFFVWLMFLTPHPNSPVPTYETLQAAKSATDAGWISLAITMVAILAFAHYGLLIWWLHQGKQQPQQAGAIMFAGEAHIFKMVAPLVLAMSVNAGFVVALVFIPGLWNIKEWLFPFALLVFLVLFIVAFRRWRAQQVLLRTNRLSYQSKGLIELLATFAFAMITVGFSTSAAMSDTTWIHTTGIVLSLVGAAMTIWAAIRVLIDRLPSLRAHPIAATATGSLLMGVPILTVLGIAAYRVMMAGKHHFEVTIGQSTVTAILGILFLAQILIFFIATPTLKQTGGWRTLVSEQPQGASFSLICPGVGLFVLGMFFISNGLVPLGWLPESATTVAYGVLAVIQAATLALFAYLLINAMPGKHRLRQRPATNQPMASSH
ncbi:TsoY family (seleno)protein [Orrella daihaiensis]|uniref:Uncharacterized protein n=1 Tax=Orrella daihaiensis TaxID=2782176 RepID=A0ABY4AL91_9BURK|nr:hypothetical protein [Orrella daihaiensis]UOD51066.1 hypothetical protein DHf2319_03940 [Orrella daihaiensis]